MKLFFLFSFFFSFLFSNENFDRDLLDIDWGKQIYQQTCISCHGAKGDANTNLNLVVKPRDLTKSILSEEQIFHIVKKGSLAFGSKADIMPSFGTVFNEEQMRNVAYYVFETFTKPRNTQMKKMLQEDKIDSLLVDMNVGKKIFKRTCSMCHGIIGNGDSEYVKNSTQDQEFIYPYNLQKILLDENQIYLYAKHGGVFWGTEQDAMPAWKNKYNDQQLKSVAHYITQIIQKTK